MHSIDHDAVDALLDWMIDGARPNSNANDIIDGICKRVVAAGVPVSRFALFIYTLHPNLIGWRFTWTPQAGVQRSEGKIGLFSTDEYRINPLPTAIGGASRLDFTAIGRPVNYAARPLGAASVLGLARVASELVTPHLRTPARLASAVELKGFSGAQPVFTW